MAAVPISAAYVQGLRNARDHNKSFVNIETESNEKVKESKEQQRLPTFRTFISKISASCQEQTLRIYIEKQDPSRS